MGEPAERAEIRPNKHSGLDQIGLRGRIRDPEKLGEFVDVMSTYGEVDVTRSGALAIALETKKLKLQPPVPTSGAGLQARPVKI